MNNNSIHFSCCFFTRWLNSSVSNYTANTNTKIQYKNQKKRNTKQTLHTSNNEENWVNLSDDLAAQFDSNNNNNVILLLLMSVW
jgi:hypothetical protein